ncbi:uncharacterized protein LOC119065301 isoform X1 [Artibeus jamaicensis]|uniref:uncharacterized protein LOC119065301 isoform X1 n=1 Tax=Artibeus jamaicensis TaxID=9417 RepID=UPI00235ADBC2|nr:uncharacterized protein LOC119065301 isoform X1 [Artibeus jamaicensis]
MIQTNQKQFPSGLRSVLEVPGICRSPGRERGTRTMWLLPALLLLLLPAKSATTHPPEPVTPFAPASLAPSPPIVQSGNSSLSLARSLLCNIHFMLLTFIKVPLLVGLLCVVMRLSRRPGGSQGNELHLSRKPAAPLPPTPRLGRAEPADLFSGNKRGGSPLGRGPPSSWPQGRSQHNSAPRPPAQEQRGEQRRCSAYTPGPRGHLQPQPCGSSRSPLSCDYAVALPGVGR